MVAEYADILQIGARNAQNFQLLIAAAKRKSRFFSARAVDED